MLFKRILGILLALITVAVSLAVPCSAASKIPAPTGVTAEAESGTSVKISWKKVNGAKKYIVYWSSDNKNYKSFITVKTTYTVKKYLTAGKTYYFKVKAVNDKGKQSAFSRYAKITLENEDDEDELRQYTFRSEKLFSDHYKKHGAEFGKITKEEYLKLANELIASKSDNVLHKEAADGDRLFFDKEKGWFLVISKDGYIRTFFIPKAGIDYWNRQ